MRNFYYGEINKSKSQKCCLGYGDGVLVLSFPIVLPFLAFFSHFLVLTNLDKVFPFFLGRENPSILKTTFLGGEFLSGLGNLEPQESRQIKVSKIDVRDVIQGHRVDDSLLDQLFRCVLGTLESDNGARYDLVRYCRDGNLLRLDIFNCFLSLFSFVLLVAAGTSLGIVSP